MTSPIFFDETGRRRRLVGRIALGLLILILLAAVSFAATLVEVPAAAALAFDREREQPLPFITHIARIRRQLPRLAPAHATNLPQRIGFYVPWDEESATSLHDHWNDLDTVVAADATINTANSSLNIDRDVRLHSQLASSLHHPAMLLMIQNIEHDAFSAGTAWCSISKTCLRPASRNTSPCSRGAITASPKPGLGSG